MSKKNLSYCLITIVLITFTAIGTHSSGFIFSSSFWSEHHTPERTPGKSLYSPADSLKHGFLVPLENDTPKESSTDKEEDTEFFRGIIERGIRDLDFKFPNIFDFL